MEVGLVPKPTFRQGFDFGDVSFCGDGQLVIVKEVLVLRTRGLGLGTDGNCECGGVWNGEWQFFAILRISTDLVQ